MSATQSGVPAAHRGMSRLARALTALSCDFAEPASRTRVLRRTGLVRAAPPARGLRASPALRFAAAAVVVSATATATVMAGPAVPAPGPDGSLRPGETWRAVLANVGDERMIGLALPAGGRGTLTVSVPKASRARPAFDVIAPDGAVFDTVRAGFRKASVRIDAGTTAVWRSRLSVSSGSGGLVHTTWKATHPSRVSADGTGEPGDAGDAVFGAVAGSVLRKLTVSPAGGVFDVVAPSGRVVGTLGHLKAGSLTDVPLPETGDYRVRRRGGGSPFRATAFLRAPRPRKLVPWSGIEAPPDVATFGPAIVDNDGVVQFTMTGVGLSVTQSLDLLDGPTTVRTVPLSGVTAPVAVAQTFLDVAPGTYAARLRGSSGFIVELGDVTVQNRPPQAGAATPDVSPWTTPLELDVRGSGFDLGVAATVRHGPTGDAVRVLSTSRIDSQRLVLTLDPVRWTTGPLDITLADPGAQARTLVSAVDLVGFVRPPADIVERTGVTHAAWAGSFASDVDPVTGLVCVALRDSSGAAFVLFDPASGAVVSTVDFPGGRPQSFTPTVKFHPGDRVWLLGWTGGANAMIRICEPRDLNDVRGEVSVGAGVVSQISAAVNPDDGGFLLAWNTWNPGGWYELKTARVLPQGRLSDTSVKTVIAGGVNALVARSGSGEFSVYLFGFYQGDTSDRVRLLRVVSDAEGQLGHDLETVAAQSEWYAYFLLPQVAECPADGSVLVTFTTVHPVTSGADVWGVLCEPDGKTLRRVVRMNDALPTHERIAVNVAWNADRGEWAAVLNDVHDSSADQGTFVRFTAAGSLRMSTIPEKYEGAGGSVWGSAVPGTFGFARLWDGTEDGVHHGGPTLRLSGGVMR